MITLQHRINLNPFEWELLVADAGTDIYHHVTAYLSHLIELSILKLKQ